MYNSIETKRANMRLGSRDWKRMRKVELFVASSNGVTKLNSRPLEYLYA
jgi:hypothetical protein